MGYDGMEVTGDAVEKDTKAAFREWGYESPCLIGKGAFADVYRVKQCFSGKVFACKVSRERERLQREGLFLQQIEHPLFPLYLDFKEREERGFLFMEYIPGTSLHALVMRRGKLSCRQAVRIGTALAEGLCYLHEQKEPIFFRDLKPENVIIRENGEVGLVDLGSAVRADADEKAITGTPGYAAPEQWTDAENVGSYSDVYALGKVMYFMLGKGKIQRRLAWLLENCVREEMEQRIPTMRCFLNRLQCCTSRRGKSLGHKGFEKEYLYVCHILKY